MISRKNLSVDLPGRKNTTIFLCAVGRIFFCAFYSKSPLKDAPNLARLPGHTSSRTNDMADKKTPQQMDPQDIVKLLVALRRALKTRTAERF